MGCVLSHVTIGQDRDNDHQKYAPLFTRKIPSPNKIEIFSRCAICFNLRAISAKVLVFSIFSDFSNSGRSKAVMESITISLTLLTKHQRSIKLEVLWVA